MQYYGHRVTWPTARGTPRVYPAQAEAYRRDGDPVLDELRRFRAAQHKGSRAVDPTEAARHARSIHFGSTALHFRARTEARAAAEMRHFVLTFYPADGTLQAYELLNGTNRRFGAPLERAPFLRRSRVAGRPLAAGAVEAGAVELAELVMGDVLTVKGVPMRLVSCEPSTRQWLATLLGERGAEAASLGLPHGWQVGEDEELWELSVETARQRAAEADAMQRQLAERASALANVQQQLADAQASQAAAKAAADAEVRAVAEADEARLRALWRARPPMGTTARARQLDLAVRRAREQEHGVPAGARVGSGREPQGSKARMFGEGVVGMDEGAAEGSGIGSGTTQHHHRLPTRRSLHRPVVVDTTERVFGPRIAPPPAAAVAAQDGEPEYCVDFQDG